MPPDLDIYGLTKFRDAATIDRFLDAYVDREKSWNRGDEELMIERLPSPETDRDVVMSNEGAFESFDWEPALTLSHTIARGLAYPRRAFSVYLVPKQAGLTQVILSFTFDDQLILGIGIDDEGAKPENEMRAREILDQLAESYACHIGLILAEEPPPLSETAFYARP